MLMLRGFVSAMALTPAEKQRRFREKRNKDQERRAAYLEHERMRWVDRKQRGIVKSVKELSPQDQRLQRSKWKEAQRISREIRQTHNQSGEHKISK